MKRSEFLSTWTGGINPFGEKETFVEGQCSSLDSDENQVIENGGVVFKVKNARQIKVFLQDELKKKMTAIISNSTWDGLKPQLKEVGYSRFVKIAH